MPTLDATLPIVKGDCLTVKRTVTGVPAATTLSVAWLTVKTSPTDAYASALIALRITPSLAADGQITDTGGSGTGAFVFELRTANTRLLTDLAYHAYCYDIQVKTAAGQTYTVERGYVALTTEVTDSDT